MVLSYVIAAISSTRPAMRPVVTGLPQSPRRRQGRVVPERNDSRAQPMTKACLADGRAHLIQQEQRVLVAAGNRFGIKVDTVKAHLGHKPAQKAGDHPSHGWIVNANVAWRADGRLVPVEYQSTLRS